ncbi:MAG: ABC transporter ATP-binding protein/permease [Puniceicoccales bacterium]|jgi:subfamily B ATP-binding cassette protein MsbA|nr:ABC transporter ATP-binding protein/permease [Puniceicoccales bacterium]
MFEDFGNRTCFLSMRELGMRNLLGYLRFLKNTKREVLAAIASGIVYGLSSGFGIPMILKYASGILFSGEKISGIMLSGIVLLPMLIMFIRGLSGFLSSYYFAACGQHIVESLRVMIFKKIQRLHLGFFNNYPPSELISRSINASTIIQTNLVDISSDIITKMMVLIGALGYLTYLCLCQSELFVLLLFLTALPLFIFPIRRVGHRLRQKSGQMQGRTAAIIDNLNHNLSAIKEVRAFGLENQEIIRYRNACHAFSEAFLKVVKYQLIISPIVEILSAAGVGFAMFYAYKRGLKLEIFMPLATALYFSYDAIKRLGDISNKIQMSMAAVDRIEAILNEPEKIVDPENPVYVEKLQGDIQFQNVTFAYTPDCNVLQNINVAINHGQTYALVGSSGSGKSTFVNMILRFYDPDQGNIRIDGIDLREMMKYDLRKNIGYVPQDPALINDTIFNNIIWGKPDASRDEVVQATRKAYAHDFITKMPNDYNTRIGESGNCLSGGQRQRIALARVFLRNCPILIFDEATSALDSESQWAIYNAIKTISRNKTVIMISHRFSMMSIVDEVLVFENGKIAERGSPKSLLLGNTLYRNLYEKQQMEKT